MEHVQVLGIHADPASVATVLLLGNPDAPTRVLPIFIGQAEARAIALGLANVERPRPGTHELMVDVIEACDAQVDRVMVTELVEGTFIAVMELTTPWGPRTVSARPSDAVAVAVRAGVPLLVANEVLDQAAVPIEHGPDEPFADEEIESIVAAFQDQLASATPADFVAAEERNPGPEQAVGGDEPTATDDDDEGLDEPPDR